MEEEKMSPENGNPDPSSSFLENSPYDKKSRYLKIIAIVAGALVLLGGAVFFFTRPSSEEPSPSPSPLFEQPSPSPSPEPELKRSDLRLQVLNGSGRAGVAGEAKEYLEELGYKVEEIGNADSFDYEKTEIRIKNSKRAYLELLREDLSEEYDLTRSAGTLSETAEFDAVIVIGGPQPSPSPSPSPSPQATPSASPSPSPSPTPSP